MDINDITAMGEGKSSSPQLVNVSTYLDGKPLVFKAVYLTAEEIEQIRAGLDGPQWYAAMSDALRATHRWPVHLQRFCPLGRLHAMIANVLIVER